MAVGLSRRRLIDDLRMKNLELEAQTEKTVEASDTLKKFLAMFSHELRSPLNSIIGFSELLTSDMHDLAPETMREFMKNIQVSGRHLQQILNDILDLSKIEAGQLELHIATYPTPYFEEAVQRVLAGPSPRSASVSSWSPDPDLDELVVDQTRFKQILINLVSNAVKFSRDGGVVEVSSRRVGNDMVFSVKDYGRGIRAEEIPGLFRPFRRARAARHRTAKVSDSAWRSPGSSSSCMAARSGSRANGRRGPRCRSASRSSWMPRPSGSCRRVCCWML